MLKGDWEELEAQVEGHGPETINFYLDDGASDEFQRVDVQNIMFEDNCIKVFLA
jgi:hypothetical protein